VVLAAVVVVVLVPKGRIVIGDGATPEKGTNTELLLVV
jgi:hypothetical protein